MSYETIKYKRCTIRIEIDDDPQSPRECDNVGTMLCCHRKYSLGDRRTTAEEIIAVTKQTDVIWIPLYLYDHSGITMSAGTPGLGGGGEEWMSSSGRFACDSMGWDTSTVGIIYCTKQKAVEEYGKQRFTKKVYDQAVACLFSEVEEYARYLEGNVYGYTVESPDGEDIDSCWGYIEGGANRDEWYCVQDAKRVVDSWRTQRLRRLREERAATWAVRRTRDHNAAEAQALV